MRMRLSDFILSNLEPILAEWEEFARGLAPGSAMSVIALRDHAESILRVTARDMISAQTPKQQSEKSKGLGGAGTESGPLDAASERHAIDRLGSGFNLIEVVSEYRALRASVLHLWREKAGRADEQDLEDLTRFNESIDQSLAEAVRSFTSRVAESRELFLATLGHDLRAPLNGIVLSTAVLRRSGQLDDEHDQIAARMNEFGMTMAGMIDDLLDFTRARLGSGMPVKPAPMDFRALGPDVLAQFRVTHPDRILRFDAEGDVTGEWDAGRLRQVLSNLVANALEHGDHGDIDVSAVGVERDVVLTVTNQGPAIPASAIPTLFDPFVRGAATRRSDGGGVGLGLFIAREIVAAHGGTITVASSPETGTVFTVRLPRKQAIHPNTPET
jgi:signal transduction histidine kinase